MVKSLIDKLIDHTAKPRPVLALATGSAPDASPHLAPDADDDQLLEPMSDPDGKPDAVLSDFYGDILPSSGHYCLWTKTDKQHHWAGSLDELVEMTQDAIDNEVQGLYFATAAFDDQYRKQANVLGKKCFYLDLDAGAVKLAKHGADKVYATQQDAKVAAVAFCKAFGLTPTYFNSSGEGLHLYWALDEQVGHDEWTTAAKKLSRLFKQYGLKEDSACTADSARLLRPIGAMHENGKAVKALQASRKLYDFDAFVERVVSLLNEDDEDAFMDMPKTRKVSGINADVLDSDTFPEGTYDLHNVARECAALADAMGAKGNVEEPHWRAMLGIVKFTTDPDKAAHEYSKGHPEYDRRETQQKLDNWKAGPTTCAEFAKYSSKCGSCPHRGRIKSPLHFGQILTPATGALVKPANALLQATLPDWACDETGKKRRVLQTTANLEALSRLHGWRLRYNVMAKRNEITMPGRRIARDDHENAALAYLGDACVLAGMSRNGIAELVDAVAGSNPYHPAHDWVVSLPWDGVSRSKQLHESLELFTSSQSGLRAKLLDAWMLQAIGALESNGISAQGILVLAGNQDVQKTRWAKSLCPVVGAVREGIHLDPLNKDSLLLATNGWITELGELDSTTRKADVSALKAFITRNEDILRPAYARRENVYARRTVFVGSVNGTGFLLDETGDRRFWTIAVRYCHLLSPDTMQQVWAEYRVRYLNGERWYFDAATKAELAESNSAHRTVDPIRERILTTFDWSAIDWASIDPESMKDHAGVKWLTATDICLRIGLDRPSRSDATRAGSIVSELNRASSRRSNGAKLLAVPQPAKGRI